MSRVTQFLAGNGPDHKGRKLDEILKLDDQWWDDCHDFIQWLFPLPKASGFFVGNECPVLIEDDMNYYHKDENAAVIYDNLVKSTERYLAFLGLEFDESCAPQFGHYRVRTSDKFVKQANYWLKANDHNHLRINRMLQCLVLFGMENIAKAIFQCLSLIKCEFIDCITDDTMVYWRNALTGYSY